LNGYDNKTQYLVSFFSILKVELDTDTDFDVSLVRHDVNIYRKAGVGGSFDPDLFFGNREFSERVFDLD
jgi:hypothetical protein